MEEDRSDLLTAVLTELEHAHRSGGWAQGRADGSLVSFALVRLAREPRPTRTAAPLEPLAEALRDHLHHQLRARGVTVTATNAATKPALARPTRSGWELVAITVESEPG